MDMSDAGDGMDQMIHIEKTWYKVEPDDEVKLSGIPSYVGEDSQKTSYDSTHARLSRQLTELQDLLYADQSQALLVVLQAMDACGKDSTIRRCFGMLNPQRCRTHSFKEPTRHEQRRDFLWRVHARTPAKGTIGVFNRSHYEAVLVEKVRELSPPHVIEKRYHHINGFEAMLADEGTTVIKFYLHAGKQYQKKRLERRIRRPDKRWKFNRNDLTERRYWDDYMRAYENVFSRCSTERAPWYIVPSERRWYRDIVIMQTLVEHLRALNLKMPQPDIDLESITIPD
ncbi:MAG: PPK2 family polyphosphate kinase [bacterium]